MGGESERELIAEYLGERLHDLYERRDLGYCAGVRWAMALIGGKKLLDFEPEPRESVDEFLRRRAGDGET